jgi:hypothetical protein
MTEEERVIQGKADLLTKAKYIKEAADQFSAVALQPHTQENAGVLLFGTLGAGKSTIVNYLLGNPLILWIEKEGQEREDRTQGSIYLVDESNPQAAKIGDEKSAETKYIHTYTTRKPGVTYGPSFPIWDTPGVFDNDTNRDVINLLTLERAIQQVQNIKLAVIIEFGQFQVGRGSSIKEMARLLGILLSPDVLYQAQHNKVPNQASILFIVNKCPGIYNKYIYIVKQVKKTREALQAEFKKETNSASQTSLANAIQLCLIMEQTPESHLIIVNPVDEGESRSLIFNAIDTTFAISADQFIFNKIPQQLAFRDNLQTRYIEPYLAAMRKDHLFHFIQEHNNDQMNQLSHYESLLIDERVEAIKRDLEFQRGDLTRTEAEFETITDNLKALEGELEEFNPESEIIFKTILGNARHFTLLQKISLAVSVLPAGYAGWLTGAAAFAAFTNPVGAGLAAFYAGITTAGMVLAVPMTLAQHVNDSEVDIEYIGPEFTRVERGAVNVPADFMFIDNAGSHYVVVKAPDTFIENSKLIVTFKIQRSQDPKPSECVIFFGKKKNSDPFKQAYTDLLGKISTMENKKTFAQEYIDSTKRWIDTLSALKEIPDTVGEFRKRLNTQQRQDHPVQLACQNELSSVAEELEAVNTILNYVTVPFAAEYQEEYKNLKARRTAQMPVLLSGSDQTFFPSSSTSPQPATVTPPNTLVATL